MPIRLNLLAESQYAEEMRRKDPVKRAIWIGAFIVAVTLVGSLTLQFKISATRSDIAALDVSWRSIEAKVKEVDEHRRAAREIERKLSAVDQFSTNRMLWATVLDTLQRVSVPNIQLVHLRTEQNFLLNEGAKPRTNDSGTVAGKPASVTERIVLSLDGKDFSPRQAEQVPAFKQALATAPYFAGKLQKTNNIQLTSLTAPQLEGSRAFVRFGLQLFFDEKERRLSE